MKRATLPKVAGLGTVLLTLCPCVATGQPAPFPSQTVPFSVDTGTFRGGVGPGAEAFRAFRRVVRIPGALWLQLHFGNHELGPESFVTVTSIKDGEQQRLDTNGMRVWQNRTAMFNGDAVQVELHVAPGEEGIFFTIKEVIGGEEISDRSEVTGETSGPEAICGATDDRVGSAHRAVGRTTGGCTGYIVSNGAYLTAGHCTPIGQLHFNIPLSQPNGGIVAPPLADQCPVTTVNTVPFSLGDDWAVFDLGPDADGNNRLAVHAQGAFFGCPAILTLRSFA